MDAFPDLDTLSLLNIFTEDTNKPSVGNNSGKKYEVNGHSPRLSETGIHTYNLKLRCTVVHGQGDKSNVFVSYKGEEERYDVEEISSMILTNMREIAEVFPCEIITEVLLTTAISYCFGKMSSNFGENYVLIFDPGCYGPNGQKICDVDIFTKLIRSKKVKLDEVAITACGQLGQLHERVNLKFKAVELFLKDTQLGKLYMIQSKNSPRIQGKNIQEFNDENRVLSEFNQPYVDYVRAGMVVILYMYSVLRHGSLEIARRLGDHDASRIKVIVTIFDPGGYLNCSMMLNLLVVHLQFFVLQQFARCSQWERVAHERNRKHSSLGMFRCVFDPGGRKIGVVQL